MCEQPSPAIDVASMLQRALHIDTQAAKLAESALAIKNKNDNGVSTTEITFVDRLCEPTKQHKKQLHRILRRLMKKRKHDQAQKPLYGPPHPPTTTTTLDQLERLRQLNASLPNQRTPEWHAQRQYCISASECCKVLGNPKPVATFVFDKATAIRHPERCVRRDAPPRLNNARGWGVIFEQICQKIYSQLLRPGAVVEEFGSLPHPTIPFLRASPDGICSEHSQDKSYAGTMVEFKAPYSRALKKACIKDDYLAQMQLQLEVTGLDKCDFVECVLELIEHDEAHAEDHPLPSTFTPTDAQPLATHAIGYIVSFPDCPSSAFVYGNLNDIANESVQQSIASLECTAEQRAQATVHYWRLKQYQLITIYRNQQWFHEVMLPKLTAVWTRTQELVTSDEKYKKEREQRNKQRRPTQQTAYAFRN